VEGHGIAGLGSEPIRGAEARIAAGLVAAGVAYRAMQTFPVHLWAADADSLGTGLVAFRVLSGDLPVFYNSARLGAFESYIHALAFAVFGVSRDAMALAPLLAAAGFLVAAWALFRSLLGPAAALGGLALLAFGSPALVFWTYQPNGWGLTLLFLTVTLLAAERIVRGGAAPAWFFVFGLASGLGVWNCLISLAGILPAVVWVIVGRPSALRRPAAALSLAGFLLGAAPWLGFNLRYGWPSLTQTRHVRSIDRHQALDNARHLATYSLPELVADADSEDGMNPPGAIQRALARPVGFLYLAGVFVAVGTLFRAASRRTKGPRLRQAPALLLLLGLATIALNVFSEAGSARGLTVRYVLPAILLAAGGLGLLLERVAERSRLIAIALLGGVIAFNVSGALLPGSSLRRRLERDGRAEQAVVRLLQERGIQVVWGDYWVSYPFNFLTRERVRGIPVQKDADFYGYAALLPDEPVRWCLYTREQEEMRAWTARVGIPGEVLEPAPSRFVFLPAVVPESRASARALDARLTGAHPGPGA
jgi:4-amino-4-deoxy-L-arabinose transferase-like glycosyltransferase